MQSARCLWAIFTLSIIGIGLPFTSLKAQDKALRDSVATLMEQKRFVEADQLAEHVAEASSRKLSDDFVLNRCRIKFALGQPMEAAILLEGLSKKALAKHEVLFEVAEIRYHSYDFSKAAEALEQIAKNKKAKAYAERATIYAELARRSARMLDNTQYIEVIDSISLNEIADLSHATPLTEQCGTFFFGPNPIDYVYGTANKYEMLGTKPDLDGVSRIIYAQTTASGEVIESRALDELKLPGGEYYPVLRQDGQSIIFASPEVLPSIKSKASQAKDKITLAGDNPSDGSEEEIRAPEELGRFDLYTARRDPATERFMAPIPLGMPFNSPADDLMLVYDDFYGIGLLVSNRFTSGGRVNCYIFVMRDKPVPPPTNDPEEKKRIAALLPWRGTQDPSTDYTTYTNKLR